MNDQAKDLAAGLQGEIVDGMPTWPREGSGSSERSTTHFTQLPDAPPGSPIMREWNFYRQMIGCLLAEGHSGKWLLIKDEQIIGIWDTEAETNTSRLERFPRQPVLMKQILAEEPILRIGYNRLCSN
jgi:hypothetical protein